MICAAALAVLSCNPVPKEGAFIKENKDGSFSLFVDGVQTYIKGIGGTNKVEIAAENDGNAFRTWSGSVESIKKDVAKAAENNMFIMQGIGMSKRPSDYASEEYKDKMRKTVKELAETFKDDKNILVWGIGNEIQLDGTNGAEVWKFVNELSDIIKSVDTRHLTSTVISHDAKALDSIAVYAPSLDLVGINSYGSIGKVEEMVENSLFKGPYMITEWGPTGWWECSKTEWGAPIEQTSEEKRIVYEDRYNNYISGSKRCLGSFCFLWGQKEERTPTWFCMFVESKVEGLPLKGEKTPMVEAMQRVWSGKEPDQTAPVVAGMTVAGKPALESPRAEAGKPFTAEVTVSDREGDTLTYVWELLYEATVTAHGGAWEPRPDRVGDVITTDTNTLELNVKDPGNYRLYVYILDGTGFVSTANVPFQLK